MEVSVSGKKMEIGQAFATYAEDRLKDHVLKYFEHALEAQVIMTKDGHHVIIADIYVHAGRGIELRGTAKEHDPHVAFDKALEKLTTQLRRYKNRLNNHHRNAEKIENMKAALYVLQPSEHDDVEKEQAPTVIAEMDTNIPTLSVSDAVMRLELSDHPVLIFKNASHNGINVVFRRPDGNIGWADPRGEKNTVAV